MHSSRRKAAFVVLEHQLPHEYLTHAPVLPYRGVMKLNANDGYPHTADNLDDETIDNLRNEALDADDSKTAEWCRQAVNPRTSSVTRATYRRLLAAHLNAIVESEAC